MAYSETWDNAAPDGTITPAADLDVELQNLKSAISERMDDLVGPGNWANDVVEPKTLINVVTPWAGTFGSIILSSIVGAPLDLAETLNGGGYTHSLTKVTIDNDGTYFLSFSVQMGLSANAAGRCFFTKNGLTLPNLPSSTYAAGTPGFQITHAVNGIVPLVNTDYIEIFAHHSNYPTGLLSFALGALSIVKLA